MIRVFAIDPVAAPRMTRRDLNPRTRTAAARRFFAYRDWMRIHQLRVPEPFHHAIFVVAMPQSWSKKKKLEHEGMPHKSTPDRDNFEKALLDCAFTNDSHIWDGRTTKLWGQQGLVVVSAQPINVILPFDLAEFYAVCRLASESLLVAPHVPI